MVAQRTSQKQPALTPTHRQWFRHHWREHRIDPFAVREGVMLGAMADGC